MADEKTPALPEHGMVKLKGGNCTLDGKEYVAKKGIVEVPAEHAAMLINSHGYEQA